MIVGLTGPSGSRKTVAAKHLERQYGFRRMHAGEPIKKAVEAMGGLRKDQVRRSAKDKPATGLNGHKPRTALEAVGVAAHSALPGLTASHLHRRIMKQVQKGRHVVVDGVRDQSEADVVKRFGGTMLRMDNGKKPAQSQPMDKRQDNVRADSRIDTSSDDKSTIRQNMDSHMQKLFGAKD